MKAVVTVTGKDKIGIIAAASAECSKHGANIIDISQTVMKEYFAMIMLVDITGINADFAKLVDSMDSLGSQLGLSIHTMHEDIFNSMHSV